MNGVMLAVRVCLYMCCCLAWANAQQFHLPPSPALAAHRLLVSSFANLPQTNCGWLWRKRCAAQRSAATSLRLLYMLWRLRTRCRSERGGAVLLGVDVGAINKGIG